MASDSLPPGSETDKHLADLLADLEESIGQFDAKLKNADLSTSGNEPVFSLATRDLEFPAIDPDAVRILQTPQIAGDQRQTPLDPPRDSLLAQLANAAHVKSAAQEKAAHRDLAIHQRLDHALRQIFEYLHQFSQHLNVLCPAIPLQFSLSRELTYRNVVWQQSQTDYRTEMRAAHALFHTVVLRARLRASSALHFSCASKKLDALKNDLAFLNLLIEQESLPDPNQQVALVLSPEIPVQLHFSADFKTKGIVLRARNLGGIGLTAYFIAPEAIDQHLLDQLGMRILGQTQNLPATLKTIPFKPLST